MRQYQGFIKVVLYLSNSRIFKFTFIISVWFLSLKLLSLIGLLNYVDDNILIVVHLAIFFFALTASPTTWKVKGFGFEAGSNDPKHTHITFNENSHIRRLDIREYGEKNDSDRLIKVANQIKIKK